MGRLAALPEVRRGAYSRLVEPGDDAGSITLLASGRPAGAVNKRNVEHFHVSIGWQTMVPSLVRAVLTPTMLLALYQ